MKDQVNRVEYYAITMEDRPGEGARVGRMLAQEKVNLLGVLAFPVSPGKTQVDLVPEHPEHLTKAAKKLGLPRAKVRPWYEQIKEAVKIVGRQLNVPEDELLRKVGSRGGKEN